MTYTGISEFVARAITRSRLIALALLVTFAAVAMQPAQAQTSSDTWKSMAIIGGSTAAGAYIGHRVAGTTGAYIGAGVGASVGYAIDRRRRQNEYNQSGYYGNDGGYYGNGVYNGGPYDPSGYPNAYPGGYPYQGNSYSGQASRRGYSQRRGR